MIIGTREVPGHEHAAVSELIAADRRGTKQNRKSVNEKERTFPLS